MSARDGGDKKKSPGSPGLLIFCLQDRLQNRSPISERLDRRCLHPLGAALGFVLNALAFLQGAEAVALDFFEMGEQVLTAIGRRDETAALGIVEPLHRAGSD